MHIIYLFTFIQSIIYLFISIHICIYPFLYLLFDSAVQQIHNMTWNTISATILKCNQSHKTLLSNANQNHPKFTISGALKNHSHYLIYVLMILPTDLCTGEILAQFPLSLTPPVALPPPFLSSLHSVFYCYIDHSLLYLHTCKCLSLSLSSSSFILLSLLLLRLPSSSTTFPSHYLPLSHSIPFITSSSRTLLSSASVYQ